ncbi:EscR/YscR/HrcR family type III secretion system export apparatus protein [Martelella alba]|uniref:EscR/YscR/HrcR family type III secretion system export apparatus protein n=1 Tax=Martelella alba TaxID=2590451 RepID=A0A506U6W7_9HYPH|nr:type III secretion system export apparatus subunit SctR [Martelella alba]TPW28841.1 EscR/YscR/HrcR family type III secretion system export apparatus protein [Martelella alba]
MDQLADKFAPILPTAILVMSLSLLPLLVVMGTSFTKISIVLVLLRNALGVQGAPSGLVLNATALTLTVFIMVPVADSIFLNLQAAHIRIVDWDSAVKAYDIVSKGYSDYLLKFTNQSELGFFKDAAKKIWPASLGDTISDTNMLILLPAHLTSELTRAFQIAFLLFLPFVIIDMVVSNVLLAMGAMMVPPMLVSLPVKLLLFVSVNGWTLLLHNLVLSYAR